MNSSLLLFKRAYVPVCYLAGLLVYCGSLYIGAQVDPHDRIHHPSLQFTTWIGFAFCMVAPFLSARRLPARVGFCAVGFLPLCVAWYMWWAMTA